MALAGCGTDARSAGSGKDAPPAPSARDQPDSTAMARSLAREIALPWPRHQDRYGRYKGNVRGFTRYGESVLGYDLIAVGLREGKRRLVTSGLKAVTFGVEAHPYQKADSNFENLAVTLAFELAERRLRSDPRYRAVRSAWVRFLRSVRLSRLPNMSFYGNHWLVEAVYVLELQRTGLQSDDPLAIIGGDRARARALAEDLVNRRLVAIMNATTVSSGGERTLLLSDPPENPLPYQGLSFGMYARAISLLGRRATPRARELLERVANASWRLAAPDGDVGYWGRNQEEAFAQAFTAYGARMTADLPGSDRVHDRRMEALARRAIVRLRDAYGGGRYGLYIVPSLKRGAGPSALEGLDASAGVASFTGLALMGLNWALQKSDRNIDHPRAASRLFADSDGASVLGTGPSRFATVRHGDLWYAVKAAPGAYRLPDLRFDFGLAAFKRRQADGSWVDVTPLKPYTSTQPESAGPILDPDGVHALPYADDIRAGPRGQVVVTGGWRTAAGAPVRTGVRFRYEPSGCGVRVSWPALAGDSFEYSAFLRRGASPPDATGSTLRAPDQTLRFAPSARTFYDEGYASASDAELTRAYLRWDAAPRARRERVTFCPP